jgi:hypothetical protein
MLIYCNSESELWLRKKFTQGIFFLHTKKWSEFGLVFVCVIFFWERAGAKSKEAHIKITYPHSMVIWRLIPTPPHPTRAPYCSGGQIRQHRGVLLCVFSLSQNITPACTPVWYLVKGKTHTFWEKCVLLNIFSECFRKQQVFPKLAFKPNAPSWTRNIFKCFTTISLGISSNRPRAMEYHPSKFYFITRGSEPLVMKTSLRGDIPSISP